MRKLNVLICSLILFASTASYAQSDKYENAMKENLQKLSENFNENLQPVTAQFERIAQAEKTQWLPYYYAAYYTALQTYVKPDNAKSDGLLDKAQTMLDEALKLHPDSSECMVVQGFIHVGRIMVDPMSRGAEYSQLAGAAFQKSIALNPSNPRGYYMRGVTVLNTPDFYGGGKVPAKPILTMAMERYEAFKPSTPLSPNWGKDQCQKQLDACQ